MKQNAWLWYLALAVGLGQYYFVSSVGSAPDESLYTTIGWTSVAAVALGIVLVARRRGPVAVAGWSFVLVALGLYLAGDMVYAALEEESGFVEVPSSADWLYLGMYPTLIVGIVLVRRSVAPGRDRAALLDAAVVGASAVGVLGAIYMYGYLTDDTFGRSAQLVASAYPLLDALLIGVAAWAVLRRRMVPATLWLVAVACLAIVVGNAVFNVAAISFSFEPGGVADLGWLVFMVFLGAASLHPSAGVSAGRDDVAIAERTRRSVLVPACALASVVPAQIAWGDGEYVPATVAVLAVGAAVLVARIGLSQRDDGSSGTATTGDRFDQVPVIDAHMPREPLASPSTTADLDQRTAEV